MSELRRADGLVPPPHHRRPFIDQVRERLDMTVRCWLGAVMPIIRDKRKGKRKDEERRREVENLRCGETYNRGMVCYKSSGMWDDDAPGQGTC